MKLRIIILALVASISAVWYVLQPTNDGAPTNVESAVILPDDAIAAVNIPAVFSEQQQLGKQAYDAVCVACHGANAQGKDGVAPPLVHRIYEPGHHGDMAFVLAAKNGVRAHHWKFGNMPPVQGITQADVLNIVAYVRALQKENGIE